MFKFLPGFCVCDTVTGASVGQVDTPIAMAPGSEIYVIYNYNYDLTYSSLLMA